MLLVLVKSVIVLGLGLGLAGLLRRRSAALRRGVLAATVLGVLLLPAISVVAPQFPALDLPPATTGVPELPVVPPEPFPWVSAPRVAAPHPAGKATLEAPSGTGIALLSLLVMVWALGAALLVGRAAAGRLRTRRMVRRAAADRAWEQSCAAACAELGLARPPAVRLGEDAGVPLVAGIVRPVIVVPASMRDWPEDRRRLVLLHELAHVAAHDCFFFAASRLACALYWPNPLAWLVNRRLRELGEAAADDAVLRAGVRASTYAEGLLEAARSARPVPSGAIAMARGPGLERRLSLVLAADGRREPLTRRAAVVLGSLALATTTLVACVARTDASGQTQPPAPQQRSSAGLAARPTEPGHAPPHDPRVQAIVDGEVARTLERTRAVSVCAVVLDAPSGRVLGEHDADHVLAPGATIRPLTVAAGLAAGLPPDVRFDSEGGRWKHDGFVVKDYHRSAELDLTHILVWSSNIGTVKIADRIGPQALYGFLTRVGLGPGLPAMQADPKRAALVSFGVGMTATPLQVATAYTALADDGVLALPSGQHQRVMPANVARAVRRMLEHVVTDPDGTGVRARIQGVRVAGKTGTAWLANPTSSLKGRKYYPSFVGIVPADSPRYVVLVGVVAPKGAWAGSQVAAPAFARIARQVLALR